SSEKRQPSMDRIEQEGFATTRTVVFSKWTSEKSLDVPCPEAHQSRRAARCQGPPLAIQSRRAVRCQGPPLAIQSRRAWRCQGPPLAIRRYFGNGLEILGTRRPKVWATRFRHDRAVGARGRGERNSSMLNSAAVSPMHGRKRVFAATPPPTHHPLHPRS